MIHGSIRNWILALVLLTPLCGQVRAATPEGAVTGTGRAVITRQPEWLRMQMVITAEGKDITDATRKLKDAKAAASKKLAELGAAEKSVEFGPTQVGAGEDPRQQYMQRMVTMRGRPGAKPPEKPKTVTVSATLKAEWPIKAAVDDELVVACYSLQERINASGLAKKDAKQLTPEEQEALEEAQAMAAGNGMTGTPGEPTFRYVSKISDADQAKAMTDAFALAKSDAAKLAKAAGGELGTLTHVSSSTDSSGAAAEDETMAYQRAIMRQMTGESAPAPTSPGEAVSANAGPLELHMTVVASFSLK